MYIIIKDKTTDNIIGLKEEIAMRLEGVVGVEVIKVLEGGEVWIEKNGRGYGSKSSSHSRKDIGDTLSFLLDEAKREDTRQCRIEL